MEIFAQPPLLVERIEKSNGSVLSMLDFTDFMFGLFMGGLLCVIVLWVC
jgi:hypothetical protein